MPHSYYGLQQVIMLFSTHKFLHRAFAQCKYMLIIQNIDVIPPYHAPWPQRCYNIICPTPTMVCNKLLCFFSTHKFLHRAFAQCKYMLIIQNINVIPSYHAPWPQRCYNIICPTSDHNSPSILKNPICEIYSYLFIHL